MRRFSCFVIACAILLTGCDNASLPPTAGYGPNPTLPPPKPEWPIPTIGVANAKGWAAGEKPVAAAGLKVEAFATGLVHPRWLYLLPNGDVLVAETVAPPRPDNNPGFRRWAQSILMRRAGAGGENANRITLLRDSDGDGTVDLSTTFLEGLYSPFGMVLLDNILYVGNSNALMSFRYDDGATRIAGPGRKVLDLPAGEINRHWTRNLVANPADDTKLFVAVGSNSNAAEFGMDQEVNRAAIWEVDRWTGKYRIFASGIRNPNGMDFSPGGTLWTVSNERDEIGGDLVPDYMTSVKEGGFYGWPYSYYGQHVDVRVQPQRPDLVAKAIKPDYALGSHTASLGLSFARGNTLGDAYQSGVFIGQHGSWNRRPRHGYRVIFVPFDGETPAGMPREVLTGFLNDQGEARGRPVGVITDKTGALLVADDVGNTIWRVTRQ